MRSGSSAIPPARGVDGAEIIGYALPSENDFQNHMTLDQLNPGDSARIDSVGGDGAFRRRLLELGLLPGTMVLRTGQAPLGDPLSFRIRGAVLCLRRADARSIGVTR